MVRKNLYNASVVKYMSFKVIFTYDTITKINKEMNKYNNFIKLFHQILAICDCHKYILKVECFVSNAHNINLEVK